MFSDVHRCFQMITDVLDFLQIFYRCSQMFSNVLRRSIDVIRCFQIKDYVQDHHFRHHPAIVIQLVQEERRVPRLRRATLQKENFPKVIKFWKISILFLMISDTDQEMKEIPAHNFRIITSHFGKILINLVVPQTKKLRY